MEAHRAEIELIERGAVPRRRSRNGQATIAGRVDREARDRGAVEAHPVVDRVGIGLERNAGPVIGGCRHGHELLRVVPAILLRLVVVEHRHELLVVGGGEQVGRRVARGGRRGRHHARGAEQRPVDAVRFALAPHHEPTVEMAPGRREQRPVVRPEPAASHPASVDVRLQRVRAAVRARGVDGERTTGLHVGAEAADVRVVRERADGHRLERLAQRLPRADRSARSVDGRIDGRCRVIAERSVERRRRRAACRPR